ncbi:MAG: CerR family C-terminal domain-containing protein [Verrucomicrobiota bacterium]
MVAPIKTDSTQAETRQQLLQAAGEVFAQVGFRAATVRAICERAGANIAAVNYHFGDKEKLYLEVLRFTQEAALKKYPTDLGLKKGASAELRLKAFIRSFLFRIFDEGPIAWHGKLMSREMIEPTAALDALVDEKIRPQAAQLSSIIRELLGAGATAQHAKLCGMSVVSQCVFYHHCRPVVARLFPEQKFSPDEVEALAEHIAAFSLAAIKQLSKKK